MAIFERMTFAGYLNSTGEASIGYQVNQKNIFLFHDAKVDELVELLEKDYYTPQIFLTEKHFMKHEFEILEMR